MEAAKQRRAQTQADLKTTQRQLATAKRRHSKGVKDAGKLVVLLEMQRSNLSKTERKQSQEVNQAAARVRQLEQSGAGKKVCTNQRVTVPASRTGSGRGNQRAYQA